MDFKELVQYSILDRNLITNLITSRLCKKLQLEKSEVCINLEAVNNASCQIRHKCNVKVAIHDNKYEFSLSYLIPEIMGLLPQVKIDKQGLQIYNLGKRVDIDNQLVKFWELEKCPAQISSNIKLADPLFDIPDTIDILLGGLFLKFILYRTN